MPSRSTATRGRRLHNVYPLLYNQCVFEATEKFQRDRDARADGVGTRRLDRQPALSDPVGRRSAKRLGRSRRVDPRRAVVGHERRAVSQLRHRRLLRLAAARPPSSTCAGCRRRCSARTSACTASASASRGRSAPRRKRSRSKWLAFRYRLIPYLQRVIAEAVATGMPVMRAMPLAFPGNALTRGFETQFMCGDALLVAPIVAAGRRSRDRAAARRVVRPQLAAALSRPARAALQGGARPVSGVRPRRIRAADGPRGPAHGRDRSGEAARAALGVRQADAAAPGLSLQANIVEAADGTYAIGAVADVKVELFGDAAGIAVAPAASRRRR